MRTHMNLIMSDVGYSVYNKPHEIFTALIL